MANASESTILLLTDEKCQVSAKIAGTHEVGILSGQRTQSGASPVFALSSSRQTRCETRHESIHHRPGGLFPPDILWGPLRNMHWFIDAEAVVRPSVDFENVQTVFILTNTQQ